MKHAGLFVVGGTIAGLVGVLSFHTRPAAQGALAGPAARPARAAAPASGPGKAPASAGPNTAARSAGGGRTVTGALERYGYGELAVRVTASGNHITSVTVPTLRTAEPYSEQLALRAIPTLRSEVLAGQNASINGVSGATYTSQAYAQSLQAALDKLHLR
jgi:uncharacterized protein with FMN-binding domain